MDYITIKEWLDKQLELRQAMEDIRELNSSVAICRTDTDITMSKGIVLVADIMGLELTEEVKQHTPQYPYWYSFVYKGVRFIQLSKERQVNENADV